MAKTGLNYYSLLDLNPSDFKVYYDFNKTPSGILINSEPNASSLFSGITSSQLIGSAYGSGKFTGQSLRISNDTGLYSSDWTMFFVFEKTGKGNAILFSNYHSGYNATGFGSPEFNGFYKYEKNYIAVDDGIDTLTQGWTNGNTYLGITNYRNRLSNIPITDMTLLNGYTKISTDVLTGNWLADGGNLPCGNLTFSPFGFVLGINDANHLFIEAYGYDEKIIKTSSFPIKKKNIITIQGSSNTISMGIYDPLQKTYISESYNLNAPDVHFCSGWYIGNSINPPYSIGLSPFSGYLNVFAYFSDNLFPLTLDILTSGFIAEKPAPYYDIIKKDCEYSYQGLTGYFSDVTFEPIDQSIRNFETGYLNFKTGSGWASFTGIITGNICRGSGYITGNILSGSGFNIVTMRYVSGVTGFATSGRYGLIGITGTEAIAIGNITDVFKNVYTLSGVSGVITGYQDFFTSPVTGLISSGNVTDAGVAYFVTSFYLPVSYSYTGVAGSGNFIHNATYVNGGDNYIDLNHSVYYLNTKIQPNGFFIYKTCQEVLGIKESNPVQDDIYLLTLNDDLISLTTGNKIIDIPLQNIYNNNGLFWI